MIWYLWWWCVCWCNVDVTRQAQAGICVSTQVVLVLTLHWLWSASPAGILRSWYIILMVFANPVSLLPHVAKSKTPSLTPYQGNNCTIYLGIFLIFSLLNDVFLHFHSQKQLNVKCLFWFPLLQWCSVVSAMLHYS